VPSKLGQSLHVKERPGSELIWKSYDKTGQLWFEANFDLMGFDVTKTTDEKVAQNLRNLLRAVCRQDGDFLSHWKKYTVETYLDFDLDWGLGASSTLIACLAEWADVNPYYLLFDSFGGSGYDVACADAEGPILYQLGEESLSVESVEFDPAFKDKLYLVHLGRKQNSREGIKHYYKQKKKLNGAIPELTNLTAKVIASKTLPDFEKLMQSHEKMLSSILNIKPVKELYFNDYWGIVKSLGAWGGDFVLVTSNRNEVETRQYFIDKGYTTFYPFEELVQL
jgi:hypothetical protein